MTNAYTFLKMYKDVMEGSEVSPRGQPIREAEDYQFTLDMSDSPLTSFVDRKLNLDYAKAEVAWYLRGDKYDTSIEDHATMWKKIRQPSGFYYSNYGQYLFGESQVEWAINELGLDKDSRRASCVLLRQNHLFHSNSDVVCTYSLNFRIRRDRLNMSVNMRSNDAVFGTTNDVFAFSMIYRIVFWCLKEVYPNLSYGSYTHKVDSLHIYERHWKMVNSILATGTPGYYWVEIPECTIDEAKWLLRLKDYPHESPKEHFKFATWLLAEPSKAVLV